MYTHLIVMDPDVNLKHLLPGQNANVIIIMINRKGFNFKYKQNICARIFTTFGRQLEKL